MKKYKILSRRSSVMGRAITYEVDGEIREKCAPACAATFEELEKQIEKECAGGAKAEPKVDEPPFDVDAPNTESAPKAEKPTTTKRGRKSASK